MGREGVDKSGWHETMSLRTITPRKFLPKTARSEVESARRYTEQVKSFAGLVPIKEVGKTHMGFYYVMPLADDVKGGDLWSRSQRIHDVSLRLHFVWGTVLAYGPYRSLVPGWQRSLSSYQEPTGRPLSLDVAHLRRVLKHSRDRLHIGEI